MRGQILVRHALAVGALTGLAALGACGGDAPDAAGKAPGAAGTTTLAPVVDPGDGGVYEPEIDPAAFVDVIDNPYLPMPVGARWVYEGTSDGEVERIVITVTGDRKRVMGIDAHVVRDTVTVGGELVEDTFDWFAQDTEGNVWYLGETVEDYEDGKVVSTEGSWEAGVDGAQPGIVMPATPAVGDTYRQEFLPGEAEDMMEIIAVDGSVSVSAGSFARAVVTRDWSPLEPDVVEEKSYAPGVGKLRERKTAGGDEHAELVEYALGP